MDSARHFFTDAEKRYLIEVAGDYRSLLIRNAEEPRSIHPTRDARHDCVAKVIAILDAAGFPHCQGITLGDFTFYTWIDADGLARIGHCFGPAYVLAVAV